MFYDCFFQLLIEGCSSLQSVRKEFYGFLAGQAVALKRLRLPSNGLSNAAPNERELLDVLRRLSNLTELDLSGNNLTSVPSQPMEANHRNALKNLTRLDLRNNQIAVIGVFAFIFAPKLEWLDLSDNPIVRFDAYFLTVFAYREERSDSLWVNLSSRHQVEPVFDVNSLEVNGRQNCTLVIGGFRRLTAAHLDAFENFLENKYEEHSYRIYWENRWANLTCDCDTLDLLDNAYRIKWHRFVGTPIYCHGFRNLKLLQLSDKHLPNCTHKARPACRRIDKYF